MQAGDTVQVLPQDDVHWIYATVITANADGSALVQIRHPANIDDGKFMGFKAEKIRTRAMVQKLADDLVAANNGHPPSRQTPAGIEWQSLMNQTEWLT